MTIASLLSPTMTLCQHHSSSKKRVLEDIAEHLGQQIRSLDANAVFSALIAREKLGSTGIGNGIAIPHCRIADCKKSIAMLITLDKGIDFDAIDNQKVDVIFVLLVPQDGDDKHLETLASIAKIFSDETTLNNVRNAASVEDLLGAVTL